MLWGPHLRAELGPVVLEDDDPLQADDEAEEGDEQQHEHLVLRQRALFQSKKACLSWSAVSLFSQTAESFSFKVA